MVFWYTDLYMDEEVKKNPKRCKRRILSKKLYKKSYYIITLPSNNDNLFDIIATREIIFKRYENIDMYVLGIAGNRESAIEILQKIILENCIEENDIKKPIHLFEKEKFKK